MRAKCGRIACRPARLQIRLQPQQIRVQLALGIGPEQLRKCMPETTARRLVPQVHLQPRAALLGLEARQPGMLQR